jgi:hypothetical protein
MRRRLPLSTSRLVCAIASAAAYDCADGASTTGWDVERGDVAGDGLRPTCLVSLTAPKQGVRGFSGQYHFLGVRNIAGAAPCYALTPLRAGPLRAARPGRQARAAPAGVPGRGAVRAHAAGVTRATRRVDAMMRASMAMIGS